MTITGKESHIAALAEAWEAFYVKEKMPLKKTMMTIAPRKDGQRTCTVQGPKKICDQFYAFASGYLQAIAIVDKLNDGIVKDVVDEVMDVVAGDVVVVLSMLEDVHPPIASPPKTHRN